jgi:hypothetical protein
MSSHYLYYYKKAPWHWFSGSSYLCLVHNPQSQNAMFLPGRSALSHFTEVTVAWTSWMACPRSHTQLGPILNNWCLINSYWLMPKGAWWKTWDAWKKKKEQTLQNKRWDQNISFWGFQDSSWLEEEGENCLGLLTPGPPWTTVSTVPSPSDLWHLLAQ